MPDQHLGYIDLVDGSRRLLCEEPDGRRLYVYDDGEQLYGVWIIPPEDAADVPVVVPAR
jgi:hypothetical protein